MKTLEALDGMVRTCQIECMRFACDGTVCAAEPCSVLCAYFTLYTSRLLAIMSFVATCGIAASGVRVVFLSLFTGGWRGECSQGQAESSHTANTGGDGGWDCH